MYTAFRSNRSTHCLPWMKVCHPYTSSSAAPSYDLRPPACVGSGVESVVEQVYFKHLIVGQSQGAVGENPWECRRERYVCGLFIFVVDYVSIHLCFRSNLVFPLLLTFLFTGFDDRWFGEHHWWWTQGLKYVVSFFPIPLFRLFVFHFHFGRDQLGSMCPVHQSIPRS